LRLANSWLIHRFRYNRKTEYGCHCARSALSELASTVFRFAIIAASGLLIAFAALPVRSDDVTYGLSGIETRLDALDRDAASLWRRPAFGLNQNEGGRSWEYVNQVSDDPESSLADRVKALETANRQQADEEARDKEANKLKPTLRWTGRIHTDYLTFPHTSPGANAFETGNANDSAQDRLLFRRLRIGVQGQIPDNMLYKLEVDFKDPNDPQLKDNFIGWEELPVLNTLLIGNQKRPYGLDHIHSTRYTIFLERPVIIEAFNQDSRRFGIQSWGFSEDQAYNWRYGVFNSQDIQNLGTVLTTPNFEVRQAEVAGRFANTIWYDEGTNGRGFAHWAIAGTVANTDPAGPPNSTAHFASRPEARTDTRWIDTGVIAGASNYELLGLEGVFNYGPLHIEGEYQQVQMQRVNAADLQFSGGYIYAAWFLTGENMVWDRQTGQLGRVQPYSHFFRVRTTDGFIDGGWGAWQIAARYSHGDLSNLNIHGGISDEVTFSLVWYFNSHSKLFLNCITGQIRDHFPVDNQTAANFTILGTRLAVDF
jgi:phosphate-selective porin OprO/OprP